MNLYRVTLKGMHDTYGTSCILANNPEQACLKMKKDLEKREIGFTKDRVFESVTLLAEGFSKEYPEWEMRLHT